MQASSGAFAALLGDGSVIAWGAADRGGDCSAVREKLTNLSLKSVPFGLVPRGLGARTKDSGLGD